MELQSGIYEIVNTVNGKRYIGSAVNFSARWKKHRKDLEAGIHHSRKLQFAWLKHGAGVFEFRRLVTCGREVILQMEQAALDRLKPEYNISPSAGSLLGFRHSEESISRMKERLFTDEHRARIAEGVRKRAPLPPEAIEKIRSANLGRKATPEARAKMSESRAGRKHQGVKWSDEARARHSERMKARPSMLGRPHTEETKRKISLARTGQTGGHHTEESRRKISEAHKGNQVWLGRSHTDDTKAKLSAAFAGRIVSDETRKRMSDAHKGKKMSDETRRQMSEAKKGKPLSEEHRAAVREGWRRRKERLAAEAT